MPAEPVSGRRAPAALDELLDDLPCGFLRFGDDGRVKLVNATLLNDLGHSRDDVIGRHVEKLLTVGTRIFYQTHWFPLLRMHGRADEIFLMLCAASGEEIGVLANAVRRDADGGAVYDCVVVRVRERQKYEEQLLRARRVAEQARAEAERQKADLQRANAQLSAQAEEMEQQQVQLQEQALELEAASEELHATNEDLREQAEELRRLRLEADEANRAKSEFLAVMSHELRTPLNAIAGYVELIDMGLHGPVTAAQSKALSRIRASQRHLLRLINDVLNLARVESGRLEYDVGDVSLEKVVGAVLPMIEPQMRAKRLACESHVPSDLHARADAEKVEQVLLNLLSNAIKFTPDGGRVSVQARATDDDMVALSVSDTGIGIAADELNRIFEPFVQVNMSTTSRAEGTGLGLAISRDLARGMGGDLTVRSTEGAGSSFTLELPRAGI